MATANESIGVLVVDDNTLIGESIGRWLKDAAGMRLLGWTGDTREAESLVQEHRPDVLVLDVDIPGGDTFALLRKVRQGCPETRVVMLSGHYRQDYIDRALDEGAMGYIVKDETPSSIIKFLRRAAAGQVVLSKTAMAIRRPMPR